MQQRADWFETVCSNLTTDDITDSTPNLVRAWLGQCATYIKSGGDVPPVAPPKP
jgi:hypothetical protein